MPVYKEELALNRPKTGYERHKSVWTTLEHQALAYVLSDWDERTAESKKVFWGGSTERPTKIYLGAVVVDHPQLDKFTQSHALRWEADRKLKLLAGVVE